MNEKQMAAREWAAACWRALGACWDASDDVVAAAYARYQTACAEVARQDALAAAPAIIATSAEYTIRRGNRAAMLARWDEDRTKGGNGRHEYGF